jgi:hypothetical protein
MATEARPGQIEIHPGCRASAVLPLHPRDSWPHASEDPLVSFNLFDFHSLTFSFPPLLSFVPHFHFINV